ncbi:MAG: hypothetical protein PW734_09925 [Verrucomicrobium sp.]|nr:hypothetical protein [Verrucomicrobium sp.]
MHPAWFLALAEAQQPAPPLPWWRLVVLVVIFAALLAVWAAVNRRHWTRDNLRRWLSLNPEASQIVVREQRWLNSKTHLCLVEVSGERFLVAQTQGAVSWQPLAKAEAAQPSDS